VRRLLLPILAAVALILSTAPASAGLPVSASTASVRLGGVLVHLRAGTTQVVTVHHTRGTSARVSFWVLRKGSWHRKLTTRAGRTGYGGLVAGELRHQGSGTTPLGTYGLVSGFGTHRRAVTGDLPYRRIRPGDYWVEDNASSYYNSYRNKAQGGFRWWLPLSDANGSERLASFPRQYEYAIVLDYNHEQVRHRGAGIFLHVNGAGATAGCVSAPRWLLRKLMHRLDPADVPVIAIGR
jgi:L,D-peptidoglycan transpeptidase YkuD (ErfK/YbiS/YcfS/YnhG family)